VKVEEWSDALKHLLPKLKEQRENIQKWFLIAQSLHQL